MSEIVERLLAFRPTYGWPEEYAVTVKPTLNVEAAAYIERLEAALEKIVGWSEAYPLSIFPEPDFKKAHEVLTKAGMTLDAISASNMRHVVKGVGEIARAALSR